MSLRDELLSKLKTLSNIAWEERASEPQINAWLDNFTGLYGSVDDERLHALYLLSHFLYFGNRQVRELLKVLYRDLYRRPIIQEVRRRNANTRDWKLIESEFQKALGNTLFLGCGNPSESGCHLLYYFRQENMLSKDRFVHSHQVFRRGGAHGKTVLRDANIEHYVFIDDFCGSGHQGEDYSRELVEEIKCLKPSARASYYMMFATTAGIEHLKNNTLFDDIRSIFELDVSFKCFANESRFFNPPTAGIDQAFAEKVCSGYGARVCSAAPVGYGRCELLIGFHHNTPDNTLPVIWAGAPDAPDWVPVFRRYPKVY